MSSFPQRSMTNQSQAPVTQLLKQRCASDVASKKSIKHYILERNAARARTQTPVWLTVWMGHKWQLQTKVQLIYQVEINKISSSVGILIDLREEMNCQVAYLSNKKMEKLISRSQGHRAEISYFVKLRVRIFPYPRGLPVLFSQW